MISLNNARLMRGEQTLLEQANLSIYKGQKIGVIGRNGSGKSSLFACLTRQLPLDQGELSMPDGLRVAQMQQETVGSSTSAVDYVIDGDEDYRLIESKLRQAEQDENNHEIARLYGELDKIGAFDIQARAEQLLSGLGFTPEQFSNPVSSFSGGWRIRLNLAAALMAPSDLLLLDEPTNHLDMEATVWLEQWLNRYQGTLLIISHDRSFLDKVIQHVISFEQKQLYVYRGNYSAFEVQRAERLAQQQAMAEKQQRRRAEIEDFVRRFRAKASKAKQAQSRLKELNRMSDIAPAHSDSPFRFEFPAPERSAEELLSLKKASIGHNGKELLGGINLRLQPSSCIGLLGFNGTGKSTLLKTLAGQLPLLGGEMIASRHLRIGYFAQHQVDVLNPQVSPVKLLQDADPKSREQAVRDFLGGFDFRGDRIREPLGNFSGGEKARLALALIAWQKPNLLLLDEPTNHLDLEMRHALTVALQGFEGALVVVSHDRHLLNNTIDQFYAIHNGRFDEFDGSLADYEKWLQSQERQDLPTSQSSGSEAGKSENKKEQRQQAAARRQQLAPIRKEVTQLEKQMSQLQSKLARLEEALADPGLYDDEQRQQLTELLQQQGKLKNELSSVEESWLEKTELLEAEA